MARRVYPQAASGDPPTHDRQEQIIKAVSYDPSFWTPIPPGSISGQASCPDKVNPNFYAFNPSFDTKEANLIKDCWPSESKPGFLWGAGLKLSKNKFFEE